MISDTAYLKKLFSEIGDKLNTHVDMYVFGGAALMHYGLKPATKDIDVVFRTENEYSAFINTLEHLGFQTSKITEEYLNVNVSSIYQRKDDRFDIFVRLICGKLSLSDSMVKRSEKNVYSNISVNYLSLEDIFLLKSIYSRDGDYEDCIAIFKAGIDWNAIYAEIESQCLLQPCNVWKSYLLERIELMQDREKIVVPIYKKLSEDYKTDIFPYLEIYFELFKNDLSFEELEKKTGLDNVRLDNILSVLEKNKKVEQKSGKYHLLIRNQSNFLKLN